MADSQDPSQPTQRILDPRRVGQNGSGLPARELTDILLLLHPVTPAATRIVANAAKTAPQHVLFRDLFDSYAQISENVEEQETIIIGENGERIVNPSWTATDIALRLSSIDTLKSKSLGFVFGRNAASSDIVFGQDSGRRISNKHFRIFLNENGIVMLQDISTNGTMVDNVLLLSKANQVNTARMLAQGSTITITHPDPTEIVEFIVKVPSRGRLQALFEDAQHEFLSNCGAVNGQGEASRLPVKRPYRATMKWDGGDNYKILGELGKGAFATVYQLASKMDGTLLAAKELEKKRFMKNGQLDKKIDNEMKIMEGLRHPNIVEFKGHHDEGDYLYIIMEFVPHGDLQQYLRENGPIDENMARPLAEQILGALGYLHRSKITHRDIKPDNILIASFDPYQFKISDFGLSKAVKHEETFLKTFCGTLLYCAPEVFPDSHAQHLKRRRGAKHYNAYSSAVDIWSFGGVLWHTLCHQPPFKGVADSTGKAMYENIMTTQLDPRPLRERGVSESCIDLLCKMLQIDPAARPTEAECLSHPWLNRGASIPSASMLQSIYEDDESVDAEHQLSQLSIGHEIPESEDEDDILEDEEFERLIGDRQSKRIRTDPRFPRNQVRDYDAESSVTPSFLAETNQTEVIEDESFVPVHLPTAGRQRLFGEIDRSALHESSLLKEHIANAVSSKETPGPHENSQRPNNDETESGAQVPDKIITIPQLDGQVSSGLFGAASMVRDLHMASSDSAASEGHSPNEPSTPKTPEAVQSSSLEHSEKAASQVSEPTPRPKPVLSRQISLPKTASHWFDPYDPSTHTLEYASKKSGFDFVAQARREAEAGAAVENTIKHPGTDRSSESVSGASSGSPNNIISVLPGEARIMPPPRRVGKLVSTPDSFAPGLVLNLDRDITSWGRLSDCSIVYQDASDTRIPKFAFAIIWHTAESLKKGQPLSQLTEDWTSMPDLHAGILTRARNGISVNGKTFKETDSQGRQLYGRLHTGDIIQIFHDPSTNKFLRFKCEFHIGSGQKPRPAGDAFCVSHK